MNRRTSAAAACAVLAIVSGGLSAQQPPSPPRAVAKAVFLETAPNLDGEVLTDPAWEGVLPTSEFIQRTPDQAAPATERTEVFIGYTDDTLYFGVVCYDSDPERIIVAHSRRDASLTETDSFRIILDTYRDNLTGFVFGTNPAGVQYDGEVTREGEGNPLGEGAFNLEWDGTWEVRALISSIGWSAEFAIPFATLRYPKGADQTWSLNMQRNIRRRNEESFWSPIPVQFSIYRLSLAGAVTGLQVPRQRNLKLTPYILGEARQPGFEDASTEYNSDLGLDLKYSILPSLTLDVTYNTDFAQVEADEQQINLDRFNLFFPEKRPFFLENAGYFTVGVPEQVELFFSRRIGIGPQGEVIPIIGGARVTGKVASRYNVGALYMRTDEVAGVAPQNDFAVARLSRDFPNRSYIGAILISREGRGDYATENDFNRTFGVDGRWGIGEKGLIQGFLAKTDTPGAKAGEHAFRLGGRYDSQRWYWNVNYTEVADDFNPEVGFLTRKGYRKPDFFVMRRIRPKKHPFGVLEFRPHVSFQGFWKFDGSQETGYLHIDNHTEWLNAYELHSGVNFTREGVFEPFEIYPDVVVPPGTYDHAEAVFVFITNQGAPVSFEAKTIAGGFFGGKRFMMAPVLRFRIGETFNTELAWTYNDIDLPGGAFETNLGRLRVSYSFTPLIYIQALIQYNDRSDVWATNLRFAWLRTANTGFHVVYNEIQDINGSGTGIPDRSLIVKYSYLFDILK